MASAGVKHLKPLAADTEDSIVCEAKLRLWLALPLAPVEGEAGGIGADAPCLEVVNPGGAVGVEMGGEAVHDLLVVPCPDAVEQGLALGDVPRRVEQDGTRIGQHVHAVGGHGFAFVFIVGGVDVEIAREVGDFQGRGRVLRQQGK